MTKNFISVQVDNVRVEATFEAMARKPISDRPAFKEIATRLHDAVLRQMTMAHPLNSEATTERKAWGPIRRSGRHGATGSGTAVLFSSGNSRANLQERSTDVSAAVKRGEVEWWLFLHDRGKGYGFWSQEGKRVKGISKRKKKTGKSDREAVREIERAGATPLPQRQFMTIDPGDEAWAMERISQAVEDSMRRAADGASAG